VELAKSNLTAHTTCRGQKGDFLITMKRATQNKQTMRSLIAHKAQNHRQKKSTKKHKQKTGKNKEKSRGGQGKRLVSELEKYCNKTCC